MPHGFFTLERWQPARRARRGRWVVVQHFDMDRRGLTRAKEVIAARVRAGMYRVVQTQRMVWAEVVGGKLKLRQWHAGSHASLMRTVKAFERDQGKWPSKGR